MKNQLIASVALLSVLMLCACRHNPKNAVGEEGIVEVDWEAIHAKERRDSLSELMCIQLYQDKVISDSVLHYLEQGADPNYTFEIESSRLKLGARVPVVNLFMRNKYTTYEELQTPLRMATAHKDLGLVDALLMAGGDINAEVGGMRPIDEAIHLEDLKLVKELLRREADIRKADLGQTMNLRLIDSLVAMGGDGSTINLDDYIREEDYKSLDHLLKYKKRIEEVDCFYVINFKGRKMIQYLLTHGLDPDATCSSAGGGLILLQACESGEWEIAKMLVEAGADPNAEGHFERRPIHYVAADGDSAFANVLLAHKANLQVGPSFGHSKGPIEEAIESDNLEMVVWLLAHDRSLTPTMVNELLLEHDAPKTKAWVKGRK
jgi:ankyrin repeat protein